MIRNSWRNRMIVLLAVAMLVLASVPAMANDGVPGSWQIDGPSTVPASDNLVAYVFRWFGDEADLTGARVDFEVTKDGQLVDSGSYLFDDAQADGKVYACGDEVCVDFTMRFRAAGTYVISGTLVHPDWSVSADKTVVAFVPAPGNVVFSGPSNVTASEDLVLYTFQWDGNETDLQGATVEWEVTKDGAPFDSGVYDFDDLFADSKIHYDCGYVCADVKMRFRTAGTYVLSGTIEHPDGWSLDLSKTVTVTPPPAPGHFVVDGPTKVKPSEDAVTYVVRWIGDPQDLQGTVLQWEYLRDGQTIDGGILNVDDVIAAGMFYDCGDTCLDLEVRFRVAGTYNIDATFSHPDGWFTTVTKTVVVEEDKPVKPTPRPRDEKKEPTAPEQEQDTEDEEQETGTPAPVAKPTDVAEHWAEPYVETLVNAGIMSGYPDGTFRPDGNVTRYELAKVLALVADLPVGTDEADHWAANYVDAVVTAGLMTGTDTGFDGNALVTRAQVATIIGRLLGNSPLGDMSQFTDAGDIPDWAVNGFAIAVGAGIFEGNPDGSLNPNAPVTRAELAKILVLLIDLLK